MIKSHLLYQLSYRGQAGRDSSEFDFGCHFAVGLFFPVASLSVERREVIAKETSKLTSRAGLDRVCRLLTSRGRRRDGAIFVACFAVARFEETHS